jgi:flagellin
MGDIALSFASKSTLLSLTNTVNLIQRTQGRLSTGLKVASPVDGATAFFQSKALNDRAATLSEKKDSIDQAVSTLSAALEGIDGIDAIVRQMKGLALTAKTQTGTALADTVSQYNTLRTQINNLSLDTTYQGVNLINNTTSILTVSFSNLTASVVAVTGVRLVTTSLATTGLGLVVGASFSVAANVDSQIKKLDAAITTLAGAASKLGSNVALLQTRLDFTKSYVNILEGGANKLTLADLNEEGANLVSLQTRQQLAISALAFAGQSEQSILSLFR